MLVTTAWTIWILSQDKADQIKGYVDKILASSNLPSICVGIKTIGQPALVYATGVRKIGSTDAVTTDDVWRLGSISKTMTATLCAALDKQGILRFESKVGDVLPDLAPYMPAKLRSASVLQLLCHRGGIAAEPDKSVSRKVEDPHPNFSAPDRRIAFLKETVFPLKLAAEPGTKFVYSNYGYTLLGTMIERVTNGTFKEAMTKYVCQPLGLWTTYFGFPPRDIRAGRMSWHNFWSNGHVENVVGYADKNREISIIPAGGICLSVPDLLTFAEDHLYAELGMTPRILDLDRYRMLHSDPWEGWGTPGWYLQTKEWAGPDSVLMFDGSNGCNYAVVWVVPSKKSVVAITSNGWRHSPENSRTDSKKAMEELSGFLVRHI